MTSKKRPYIKPEIEMIPAGSQRYEEILTLLKNVEEQGSSITASQAE